MRRFARIQQIDAGIGREGPVVVLTLLLGTAEICLACFMYYQEFMLPEVKACREREAKRRAERLMRQAERDVRKEWALYDK